MRRALAPKRARLMKKASVCYYKFPLNVRSKPKHTLTPNTTTIAIFHRPSGFSKCQVPTPRNLLPPSSESTSLRYAVHDCRRPPIELRSCVEHPSWSTAGLGQPDIRPLGNAILLGVLGSIGEREVRGPRDSNRRYERLQTELVSVASSRAGGRTR